MPSSLTAQLDVHAADERTLSHREGTDNLEAEGGADEPWRGEIHCGMDVFETEAVCYCGAERAVVDPQHDGHVTVARSRRICAVDS